MSHYISERCIVQLDTRMNSNSQVNGVADGMIWNGYPRLGEIWRRDCHHSVETVRLIPLWAGLHLPYREIRGFATQAWGSTISHPQAPRPAARDEPVACYVALGGYHDRASTG